MEEPSDPVGHPIWLGKWKVSYFTATESLAGFEPAQFDSFDPVDDVSLQSHPRFRRILRKYRPDWPFTYGLLHWSDGTDLAELDDKIVDGKVGEEDFFGALVVEPQSIRCPTCGVLLHIAAANGGEVIFSPDMQERLQRHAFYRHCPVCNSYLRMAVAEFIKESDSIELQ